MFKKKEAEQTAKITGPKKPRKKIKKWKIITAVIVVLILVFNIAKSFLTPKDAGLAHVDVMDAVKGSLTSTLDTSGTIDSENTRVYASPVNAEVGSVPVKVGQSVKKGEYLLTYDTASLEQSYTIAELQAKADNATGQESLDKSAQNQQDYATATGDIATYQAQVDGLKGELAQLESQQSQNQININNTAATDAEVAGLQGELASLNEQIQALQAKADSMTDADKTKVKELQKEAKEKEKSISKKQKNQLNSTDLSNYATSLAAQISEKNSQLADAQAKLSEAQATQNSAEAGVLTDSAKANISYTRQASQLTLEQSADDLSKAKAGIIAETDGIVTEVTAAEGTAAVEGTALITVADADQMCVNIPVSKYNLENIAMDQKATITFQGNTYEGTVTYISKLAEKSESGGAMVTVKVHINNPDDVLVIGLDADVDIQLGTVQEAVLVPVEAVNSDNKGDFVYTLENGLVAKHYVTIGMSSTDQIVIKSGVEVGDRIITTIDSTINEGMPVVENTQSDTENSELTNDNNGAQDTGSDNSDAEADSTAKDENEKDEVDGSTKIN